MTFSLLILNCLEVFYDIVPGRFTSCYDTDSSHVANSRLYLPSTLSTVDKVSMLATVVLSLGDFSPYYGVPKAF